MIDLKHCIDIANDGVVVYITSKSILTVHYIFSELYIEKEFSLVDFGCNVKMRCVKNNDQYEINNGIMELNLSNISLKNITAIINDIIKTGITEVDCYDFALYRKSNWRKAIYFTVRIDSAFVGEPIIVSPQEFLEMHTKDKLQ